MKERRRGRESEMESVIEEQRGAGKPSLTPRFYLKCCVEDKQLFPARLSGCCGRQLSEEQRGRRQTDRQQAAAKLRLCTRSLSDFVNKNDMKPGSAVLA